VVVGAVNDKKSPYLNSGCHGDRLLGARRVRVGREIQALPLRPTGKHFEPHVPCKASFSKGAARFLQQFGFGAPFSGRGPTVNLLPRIFYRRHRTRFVLHRIDPDADQSPKRRSLSATLLVQFNLLLLPSPSRFIPFLFLSSFPPIDRC
jgi:hypothetical protein